MNEDMQTLEAFLEGWEDTPERNKEAFLRLKKHLTAKPGVILDFLPRPGVTYSLRARHENQKNKPLFVMVDVIEDKPRWLSICFFGEMIDDADEHGDFVPAGLLGEDAVCFDLETYDEEKLDYVASRMNEAYSRASGE